MGEVFDLRVPVVDGDSEIMVVNYLRGVVVAVAERLGFPDGATRLDYGYMAVTQDGTSTRYRRYSLTVAGIAAEGAEHLVATWREIAPDVDVYRSVLR